LKVEETCSRLDRFLHRQYPAVSTNRWRRALKDGEILVDGCRAAKGVSLGVGQTVSFSEGLPARLASTTLRPETGFSLDILYEDENLLALNKPGNCHTHPLSASETGTLTNRLIAAFPELAGVGEFGSLQPGLLNRLDYATSGVVLVARNSAVWRDLRRQFERHLIRKEYVAEVEGRFLTEIVIEKDLTHDRGDRRRMVVSPPAVPCRGLYPARTEVFPLQFRKQQNLTQVRLVMYSGVMHQLRVHLADAGHPILGDTLYGGSSNLMEKEKEFGGVISETGFHLHCLQMTLADGLVIVAPPPDWYKDSAE
ncbi:MAG: RluA family pseudouridine synthase, partial [Deltaproteobacteria bacterium]|nr:RluA family pseudouridine synthase [Candidatus Tharpella aukensis]